ncbi:hydroxyacid dehydrogenase [Arthrobacter sp. MYb227]|uniref:D-2-hydroxyacid dehydrogenase n=1 Tax=Arthrobacter sp. MYb227 TaxID=1848601 RepID=UPI000CFD9F12|nr:D-2-hydroxyacid dehydrogenase [Arthrobacter sp. MYb227]PQZ87704.1 hydroxyacid dehydrogenase [Arthrobacter sp. MYb227]
MRPKVLIASYLAEELVSQIRSDVPDVEVIYEPELLPVPRYSCDHHGDPRQLTVAQRARWQEHLDTAEIMFDFDWWQPELWREHSPKLKWIQASQAGVGTRAKALGHTKGETRITSAAGVHAKPLAEFAVAGLLHFVRRIPGLEADKEAQRWGGGSTSTLYGRRALIIGAGSIGREVARTLDFFGVTTDGTTRSERTLEKPFARSLNFEELELGDYDIVILACPLTDETIGLFSRERIASMKPGALLVNLARGPVLDQDAIIEALESGHVAGAVLDVATPEPLPVGSPLWNAPNLILSPHNAANVDAENARLVELFITNLHRYLAGETLVNIYDPVAGY